MPPRKKSPTPAVQVDSRKRVGLYVRVSTSSQATEGTSLASQRADLLAYAERMGWAVAGVWEDAGVSGAKDEEERPALGELMLACRDGRVNAVLVTEWDRLSREMFGQISIWRELDALGVDYYSLADPDESGPEKAMVRNIKAAIAEDERRKILKRTSRGRKVAIADGVWSGGNFAPYGYQIEKDQRDKARLVVDPSEAETIRRLVSLLVDEGKSTGETAAILNAEGRTPRSATRWTNVLVRNHARRSADTWAGVWTYGKTGEHYDEITVTLPEAVLTPDRAAALKLAVEATANRRGPNGVHPLSGRITCPECGRPFTGIKRGDGRDRRYLCSNSQGQLSGSRETRCTAPTIHGRTLDAAIWSEVRPYLEHPEVMMERAAASVVGDGGLAAAEATVKKCREVLADVVSRGIRMGLDDATIAEMKQGATADYEAAVRYRDSVAGGLAAAAANRSALEEAASIGDRIREHLDDPTDETMQEVFRLLDVRVTVRSFRPLAVDATGRVVLHDLPAALGATGSGTVDTRALAAL